MGFAHSADDLKRDIKAEVSTQLSQKQSDDAANLNNRIATEASKQLGPMNQTLMQLSEDIGKIKDHLHIARNSEPASQPRPDKDPLRILAVMDQTRFNQNLAKVAEIINAAQKRGELSSPEIIDAVQKKIAMAQPSYSEAIQVGFSIINYASFVREKMGLFPNAERVRSTTCDVIKMDGPSNVIRINFNNPRFGGCRLRLDGLSIKGGIVHDALITYEGGAFRLENVHFVNCIFVMSLPASLPSEPAKRLASELLAKSVGEKPDFSATVSG